MKPCPLKSIWMKGKWTPWAWSKQGRSVNCVTSEYEGDLHSNEHYLNSSEMKAWKKFGIWTHEVKIALIFTSLSAVQIYDFHIFKAVYSPLHGFIWNQHNDQLPVGLLAQLVEHCTGIAEVMGSNPVQAFFSLLFK